MDKTSNFSTSASDFEFKSPFQPSNNALDTFDEPLKENNVELSTSSKCKSPIHGVHISADPTNDTDAVKVSNNSSKVMHQVENDCSSEQSETQNSSNVSSVASNESDSNSNIDVTSTECSPSTTNVVIPTPSNLNFNSLNISGCSSQSQIIHPSIIDNLTNHESTTKENIKDPKEQSSSSLVDIPPQLSPSSDRCVEDIPFDSDVSFPETGNLDDDSPSPLHEVSSSERMPKLKEKNPSLIPKNQELGSMTITVSRDCPESKNVLTTINRPINLSSPQNFTTVSSTNHNTINGSVCSSTNASTSVVASAQNSKDSNKIFITPRKLVKINKLPDDIIKSDVKKINLASLNKSTFNNSSKGLVKLNSLSNKVSMSLGQNIDFKVLSMPPPNLKEKVEKLKTTILNRNDTNNAEFGQLMKNASSDDQSQKFLQKIQESLKISDKCDEVVFHVSNSVECSNNLSISSLDVTTSPSGVKVMLCSESDAIEKYDLLNESPPITRTPNKRGRGKQPRKASKETMEPEDINNFLANKELISNFRYHLSIMMEGFSVPREWEGIDPVIAMLASKKQNPNFAHIDIDSMMQLYAKILHYENFINTTNEVPSTQSPKSPTSSSEKEPEVTSPVCNIKHEIIEEIESSPYSVVLSSVHPPADRSVEYVPERYHSSNGQKIGRGKHVITFDYDKSHFGPIYAETDEEVRAIVNLVQEKVAEIKCRKENRTLYSYSSGSVIAESLLPEDVLNYIRESFTVKAIRNPSSGLPSVKSEPLEDSFQQKEPVSASRLERNVFSKDIPKVSESSKSKENSHISKKIDFANEISDLLGKIDPKSEEPPQVISSSQRVTNLRPLLLKPNPNKRKRPIRKKKNSEITPEEALGASSLYVRPNKQEKVMKLLAQKEKKG
ncbi:unnamed protein product [Lepeophtheirus salmonis]|uniref:(salmon louse) hypothetical protein n=1 Tax=Lepeophtheirus salmonis TaxID=72036 RepID=A0A7R8D7C1_LEPSM|nr:unnamed protein product [Lepeophtheirus salmonis]CAF2998764.1 unnamed protein product [Lepeophtheirus salmonis]